LHELIPSEKIDFISTIFDVCVLFKGAVMK